MSEQTSQEPTMEEILASIRRIISEDEPSGEVEAEAPAAAAPPAPEPEPEAAPVAAEVTPPPAPEPAPAPVAAAPPPAPEPEPMLDEDEDDALELTQKVETLGDLDVVANEPPPAPVPEPTLVSAPVAMAAASAFGQLSAAIGMPRSDRTLEDVVREMLQPLLKQWLDDNLSKIVQEAVQAEVERISRTRVR